MRILKAIILLFPIALSSQIDHWESVILEGDEFSYLLPQAQPDNEWTSLEFDDVTWSAGNTGIGYGDNDDNEVIANTISLYLRKRFEILDISTIEQLVLSMDYDDGFVAYLNGVEFARKFVAGEPPFYNQVSFDSHEAKLYQGIAPENFTIDIDLLNEGSNVLAIQVHNRDIFSSDMSAIPILSLGLSSSEISYRPTPDWYNAPLDFVSSHLPIVIINTNGQQIWDEPKVTAEIGIIYNGEGELNNINDDHNEYSGICGIEIRGESTQIYDKKSYLFEFWDSLGLDLDTSFLNFPAEEDFILYGPYADKTMMNNVLAMKIGNQMGQYASRTRFVELVINEEYRGVYVVMEKIKRDKNRLDISKLRPEEITGDDLTGGYIVRIDKGIYQGWESNYNYSGGNNKIFFQYYYPDQNEIRPEQKTYIQSYFDEFEEAIAAFSYTNSKGKHYSEYIHLRSFIDNFIINELSKNVDAYRLSSYFHKDKKSKNGKIVAGPLWDYNFSFGNADYCGGDDNIGWIVYQCDHGGIPFWWDRFMNDEFFQNGLRCRWESLRGDFLATDELMADIDSMVLEIGDAASRNYEQFPILGTYIWPNPFYFEQPTSYTEIVENMKSRVSNRAEWLDLNIPGIAADCSFYDEFDNLSPVSEVKTTDLTFDIFPNPATDNVVISSEIKIEKIEVFNVLGQLVYIQYPDKYIVNLKRQQFNGEGTYFIKISTKEGALVKNLIIQ